MEKTQEGKQTKRMGFKEEQKASKQGALELAHMHQLKDN